MDCGLCQIVNPYKHHHQGKAQKSEEKVGVVHSELIFGGFFRWVYAMYMGYLVQKCVLTYVITDWQPVHPFRVQMLVLFQPSFISGICHL